MFQKTLIDRTPRSLLVSALLCGLTPAFAQMAPPGMPPPPPASQPAPDPESVVVTVDGTEVTEQQVQMLMRQVMSRFGQQLPPDQMQMMLPQIREMAVKQAIERALLTNAAETSGINVNDEDVAKVIEEAKQSLPEGVTLDQALAQMNTSLDEFQAEVRGQLRIEKLVDQAVGEVGNASEEDIQAFYNEHPEYFETPAQVSASHILLSFAEGETEESKAEKKAELLGIKEKIEQGADFAEMAKAHSSCPSSEQGGDLGSFGKGQMVPAFEEVAFNLKPGELSDIVETRFGYHLIRVTGKEEAGKQQLEDVQEQIGQHLSQQKKEEAWTAYMGGLREKAKITYPTPRPE